MKYIKEEKYKLVKCIDLDSEVKLSSGGGVTYFCFLDIFSASQVYFQLLKRIGYLEFYRNHLYISKFDPITMTRKMQVWFLKNVKNSRCSRYSKTRLESCGRDLKFKYELLISISDPGKFIDTIRIFIDILNEQGFKAIKYKHDDNRGNIITLNSLLFSNKSLRKYSIKTKKYLTINLK